MPLYPDETVLNGYSGGMALYVAHWESVLCLFEIAKPSDILNKLIYYTSLN